MLASVNILAKIRRYTHATMAGHMTMAVCAALSFVIFVLVFNSQSVLAASVKRHATAQKVDLSKAKLMRVSTSGKTLNEAPNSGENVTCIARLDKGAAWAIDAWILGNELYKSYQNPKAVCAGSYPFTVTEVNMFLQIHAAASITVAIDLEKADSMSIPGCPIPGDMIYIGPALDLTFPGAGLYNLQVVLDTPKVVNGPFFVGFYFATIVDPAWHLELVTDNEQKTCVSFNVWDTALGYVDLGDDVDVHHAVYSQSNPCYSAAPNTDGCFDFDGRVILHTTGVLSASSHCCDVAGDANSDGTLNITDVTFLAAYILAGGALPPCNDEADANGDGSVNITDVVYVVERIFKGGPAPVCGSTGH